MQRLIQDPHTPRNTINSENSITTSHEPATQLQSQYLWHNLEPQQIPLQVIPISWQEKQVWVLSNTGIIADYNEKDAQEGKIELINASLASSRRSRAKLIWVSINEGNPVPYNENAEKEGKIEQVTQEIASQRRRSSNKVWVLKNTSIETPYDKVQEELGKIQFIARSAQESRRLREATAQQQIRQMQQMQQMQQSQQTSQMQQIFFPTDGYSDPWVTTPAPQPKPAMPTLVAHTTIIRPTQDFIATSPYLSFPNMAQNADKKRAAEPLQADTHKKPRMTWHHSTNNMFAEQMYATNTQVSAQTPTTTIITSAATQIDTQLNLLPLPDSGLMQNGFFAPSTNTAANQSMTLRGQNDELNDELNDEFNDLFNDEFNFTGEFNY